MPLNLTLFSVFATFSFYVHLINVHVYHCYMFTGLLVLSAAVVQSQDCSAINTGVDLKATNHHWFFAIYHIVT